MQNKTKAEAAKAKIREMVKNHPPLVCDEIAEQTYRIVKEVEGSKDDQGKLRFDLIPAQSLQDLAEIYTFGAKKYGDRNWEKGIKFGRIFAAIMRHLWSWQQGEDLDPETGISHLIHAAWGCFALNEFMSTKPEMDDRPK